MLFKLMAIVILFISIGIGFLSYVFLTDLDLKSVHLNENQYWGLGSLQKDDPKVYPFKINVSESVVQDLNARLKLELNGARFTEPIENSGFQYGSNSKFVRTVVQYWLEKYDWRTREQALNNYPSFKTQISGLQIHFQHVKQREKSQKTKALLLIHGWPGSFVEYQKVVPIIQSKSSAIQFEIVIASIPGYGFSDGTTKPGLDAIAVSQIFHKLMIRLGYAKYYVQGGDWGSLIAANMATMYKEHVLGAHMSMCVTQHPRSIIKTGAALLFPKIFLDEYEQQQHGSGSVLNYGMNMIRESGYFHFQATKPDALGIALQNSPSGLVAYMLDRYSFSTNPNWLDKENGGILPTYELDFLLDNIMIYWVTNSITTSMRLYAETVNCKSKQLKLDRVPVEVPMACLNMRHELLTLPKFSLYEKFPKLVRFTKSPVGGHNGGFEVPNLLAEDIVDAFIQIESHKVGAKKTNEV